MNIKYEPKLLYVVRIISKEYAVDNFWIDESNTGCVYLSAEDYRRNKYSPVFTNIEIEALGTVQRIDQDTYELIEEFIEKVYTPIDDPEYFI